MYSSNHTEHCRKWMLPYMHKTRLLFKLMYFKLEYIGYWSRAEDIRLSPAQITAKVKCSLLSISSFRVPRILSKARIFGHICGLGECQGCTKALSLYFIIHQQAPLWTVTQFQVLYLSQLMYTNYFNC